MTLTIASPVFAGRAVSGAAFVVFLTARKSPAAAEASAINRAFAVAGIDVGIALGQFAAESTYGTRGHARRTRNWGNIAMAGPRLKGRARAAKIATHWTRKLGAVPYEPGNGYAYASFPTWLAGAKAYVALLRGYRVRGRDTLGEMVSTWLGYRGSHPEKLGYTKAIIRVANSKELRAAPKPIIAPMNSASSAAEAAVVVSVPAYQPKSKEATPMTIDLSAVAQETYFAFKQFVKIRDLLLNEDEPEIPLEDVDPRFGGLDDVELRLAAAAGEIQLNFRGVYPLWAYPAFTKDEIDLAWAIWDAHRDYGPGHWLMPVFGRALDQAHELGYDLRLDNPRARKLRAAIDRIEDVYLKRILSAGKRAFYEKRLADYKAELASLT